MQKAFTLIELLVVVLIIGILSAVALPQYRKAVAKSQTAELFMNLKAIVQAAEAVYLETGEYPTDFSVLPISLMGTIQDNGGHTNSLLIAPNGNRYYLEIYNSGMISAIGYSPSYIQLNYYTRGDGKGKKKCRALTSDKLMNEVCKNWGGSYIETSNNQNFYWLP